MRILIIEDDPLSACMLQNLLQADHEVRIGHSAPEAIDFGIRWKPTLIITAWKLDGGEGIEACRTILKTHKAAVIFVSGSCSPVEQLKEAVEALVPLHVMTRPLDTHSLNKRIKELELTCSEFA